MTLALLKKFKHQCSIKGFCSAIFSIFLISGTSQAVEIERVYKSSIGCTVKLTGPIQAGDAEQLTTFLKTIDGSVRNRVCFNSPGGSYLEGLEIAKSVQGPTGVDDGDICESACFLAFMGGSIEWTDLEDGGVFHADRVMHPGAKIGFHAPSLGVIGGNFSTDDINKAYALALLSVAELLKIRQDGKTKYSNAFIFRDSLIQQMLRTPPQQIKYVETIAQALEYQITVYPVILPGAVPEITTTRGYSEKNEQYLGFINVCKALGIMSDNFTVDLYDSSAQIELSSNGILHESYFDVGDSGTVCRIWLETRIPQLSYSHRTGPTWSLGSANVEDWWIPPNNFEVGPHMFYPPVTRIIDVPHPPNFLEINRNFLADFEPIELKGLNVVFINYDADVRAYLQRTLRNLGLYSSSIDGKWGKGTEGAFQKLFDTMDEYYPDLKWRQDFGFDDGEVSVDDFVDFWNAAVGCGQDKMLRITDLCQ